MLYWTYEKNENKRINICSLHFTLELFVFLSYICIQRWHVQYHGTAAWKLPKATAHFLPYTAEEGRKKVLWASKIIFLLHFFFAPSSKHSSWTQCFCLSITIIVQKKILRIEEKMSDFFCFFCWINLYIKPKLCFQVKIMWRDNFEAFVAFHLFALLLVAFVVAVKETAIYLLHYTCKMKKTQPPPPPHNFLWILTLIYFLFQRISHTYLLHRVLHTEANLNGTFELPTKKKCI